MNIFLSMRPNNEWALNLGERSATLVFSSIELACECMKVNDISDDEIDVALISIYAQDHGEAVFEDGKFIKSAPCLTR